MNDQIKSQTATVEFADFEKAISRVARTADHRSTLPILANVRITADGENIRLETTDLDRTCVALAPAAVPFPFDTTAPAKQIADLVKKSKKAANGRPIALHFNGVELALTVADITATLQTLPSEDWPTLAFESDRETWSIPTDELRDALNACVPCISTEETRYYLNGVFFHDTGDTLRLVSLDGHKLASYDLQRPDGFRVDDESSGFIVRRETVDELRDILKKTDAPTVDFTLSNHEATLKIDVGPTLCVAAKNIDGTFPDYQRVIPPESYVNMVFDRDAMLSRLAQIDAIATERGGGILIEPSRNSVRVTLRGGGNQKTETTLPCSVSEEFQPFGVNRDYLAAICKTIAGDIVQIDMASPGVPMRIRGEARSPLFVVMPLRT